MADEEQIARIEPEPTDAEHRSTWQATQDAAKVYAEVVGGTGTLAGGVAALKIAFGKDDQQQQPDQQKKE